MPNAVQERFYGVGDEGIECGGIQIAGSGRSRVEKDKRRNDAKQAEHEWVSELDRHAKRV